MNASPLGALTAPLITSLELFNPIDLLSDVLLFFVCGGQLRVTQPVVPDLTVFVAVRNRSSLQLLHRSESTLETWLELIGWEG